MGTDKKLYSSKELLDIFDSVSQSVIFFGCGFPGEDTEQCIEQRLKDALEYRTEQYERKKSREAEKAMNQLKRLIELNFIPKPTLLLIHSFVYIHSLFSAPHHTAPHTQFARKLALE